MIARADAQPTNGIWVADEDSLAYLSAEVVDRPPIKLLLSLVGRCNLRCFHCLGTSEELVRVSQDGKSATRDLVDFVADRVLPEIRAIRLGGVGLTEQLTSRTFDYFMERARPHAPRVGSFELITNLSVMTEQRADLLAGALTDVQVSIEGVEDNFTRLRGFPWPRLVSAPPDGQFLGSAARVPRVRGQEDIVATFRNTRAYRFLRRLGRWGFVEEKLAGLRADLPRDPPRVDR